MKSTQPRAYLHSRIAAGLVLAASFAVLMSLAAPTQAEETGTAAKTPGAISAQIDTLIEARLAEEEVAAAGRTTDTEFLRRLYLDVLGTVPTPEEVETFASESGADKRAKKIEALLASEAYGEHWGVEWYKTLTGMSPASRIRGQGQGARYLQPAKDTFLAWLKDEMAANRPYNEFAEALLTATGRTDENGATGFYARWAENVNNLAGATARVFLGTRIQCAQCHDHIYEESWKQKDFIGMAAFFATVRNDRTPEQIEYQRLQRKIRAADVKGRNAPEGAPDIGRKRDKDGKSGGDMDMDGEMGGEMEGDAAVGGVTAAERRRFRELARKRNIINVKDGYMNPRQLERAKQQLERRKARAKGNNQNAERLYQRLELMSTTPKFWMASEATDLPGIPRRMLLGRWITSNENTLFAKAVVNRYWGHFFGRGIVNPVDDFNSFNDPSHPEILDLLAKDFVANGFDLKRLIRIIVNTEAYQRTSRWTGEEQPDAELFAVAQVRPLSTEQLYHSLVRATGLERSLARRNRRQGERMQQAIFSVFSFIFDDDEGKETQDFEGSIPQGLFLLNGELLQRAVSAQRGMPLGQLLSRERTDGNVIDHLYLSAYGRKPDSEEKKAALDFVRGGESTEASFEDLLWALLNSAEFMTNH